MKQAIAGLAPPELDEVTSMTVWPSIAATRLGRIVGQLVGAPYSLGQYFVLGRLLAVPAIPLALVAFAWKLTPFVARRYRLTNQRIILQKGLSAVDDRSIRLDEFDAIEIRVLPGQKWLRAGELIFRQEGREVLRLSGVGSPKSFRHTCLKARTALISIRQVLQRQAAPT
ncbi:MAG: PH domain-containing protein [Planctomycetota bacterium]